MNARKYKNKHRIILAFNFLHIFIAVLTLMHWWMTYTKFNFIWGFHSCLHKKNFILNFCLVCGLVLMLSFLAFKVRASILWYYYRLLCRCYRGWFPSLFFLFVKYRNFLFSLQCSQYFVLEQTLRNTSCFKQEEKIVSFILVVSYRALIYYKGAGVKCEFLLP